MSHLVEVNDATFDDQVFRSPLPVIVDFWGPWCGPCKEMEPMLEEAARTLNGKVRICKLDVSVNHQIAGAFGIMQVPTLIFFQSGQPVGQTGRPRSRDAFMQEIADRFEPVAQR